MVLFKELVARYENNLTFIKELNEAGISVLRGYNNNLTNIEKFYGYFYQNHYPKVVLCGINPGRLGAGKTGIPFIDFDTLKNLFISIWGTSDIHSESERSAQFIKYVIENYEGGYKYFFRNIYLTNYSFWGYVKDNRNLNFYDLPNNLRPFIDEMFLYEMEKINPSVIIPLSAEVSDSLNNIGRFKKFNITKRLPHPYWCSFINRREEQMKQYLELIKKFQ